MDPKEAYEYTEINGPSKETRNIAYQESDVAFLYAYR